MRLLTRSDFDGLICATLLKQIGLIDEYQFVHPKDMQDGKYEVSANDVLANVPFVPGCGLWFDHHSSEQQRVGPDLQFEGRFAVAPSCARVIWDYYGGHAVFPTDFDEMMTAVDKSDSGDLTVDDIEHPKGWILLSYLVDPRTGLGRYRDYRISNYQLGEALVDYCRSMPIEQILELGDVQERIERYFAQDKQFRTMVGQHAVQQGNVIVLDLRQQTEIFSGNRFTIYTMFPTANISLQANQGRQGQNIALTCGHSITNRTSKTDVGKLMLKHGGGGHRAVGTCQVPHESADQVMHELVARLNADG